jgi:hypothetical protein
MVAQETIVYFLAKKENRNITLLEEAKELLLVTERYRNSFSGRSIINQITEAK